LNVESKKYSDFKRKISSTYHGHPLSKIETLFHWRQKDWRNWNKSNYWGFFGSTQIETLGPFNELEDRSENLFVAVKKVLKNNGKYISCYSSFIFFTMYGSFDYLLAVEIFLIYFICYLRYALQRYAKLSQLAEYISQILLKYYIPTIEMLVK
jgi:glycosyltransferase involved in cell wall biosynthesis